MAKAIDKTFLHCAGIGLKTEQRLFSMGFRSWDDCLSGKDSLPFKGRRLTVFLESLEKSLTALSRRNINFFVEAYPKREHWRILADFFDSAAFFDIETTGLSWYDCHPTVITAFKNGEFHIFIYPDNLDDFLDFADTSELLVSFNGNCFDIPFLEKYFNIPEFKSPHVDLRWVAYHAGYKNGLKEIEKSLGIKRPESLADTTGYDAIMLYYRWQSGDREALDRLIEYCKLDTFNGYLVAKKILCFYGINIDESIPADYAGKFT